VIFTEDPFRECCPEGRWQVKRRNDMWKDWFQGRSEWEAMMDGPTRTPQGEPEIDSLGWGWRNEWM